MTERELLKLAEAAAQEVGAFLLPRSGKEGVNKLKDDGSLQTDSDVIAEEMIRRALAPSGLPFVGEESGGSIPAGYCWCVDPIDGTTHFARGIGMWGVSIGLLKDGIPHAGVVLLPVEGKLFSAIKGDGATLNGKKIVQQSYPGKRVVIVDSYHRYHEELLFQLRLKLLEHVSLRQFGCAIFQLSLVIEGKVDAIISAGSNWWDVAAGLIIAEECGVVFSDWNGELLKNPSRIVVAAKDFHPTLISITSTLE